MRARQYDPGSRAPHLVAEVAVSPALHLNFSLHIPCFLSHPHTLPTVLILSVLPKIYNKPNKARYTVSEYTSQRTPSATRTMAPFHQLISLFGKSIQPSSMRSQVQTPREPRSSHKEKLYPRNRDRNPHSQKDGSPPIISSHRELYVSCRQWVRTIILPAQRQGGPHEVSGNVGKINVISDI